jgi:uracil-DNA glycosylase
MDYSLFQEPLGSWGDRMKDFILSPQCDEIYAYLKSRSGQGKVILPLWSDTFRAFAETPLEELKVVFFLQDPYPGQRGGVNVADGIALSCSHTGEEQPSLSCFLDGISRDSNRSPDLGYLCNQGVMMLNTSLTVELNRPNSHSQVRVLDRKVRLWEPFFRYFFEQVIAACPPGLVLVFCGKESQYYERFVNPLQHYIFKIEHPSAAAHAERPWKHQGVFRTIDQILKQNKNAEINWIKTEKKWKDKNLLQKSLRKEM